MRYAVESWAPEYGIAADPDQMETATEPAVIDVEYPADQWRPLTPAPDEGPSKVVFVDGVRRIDARVWIADGELARQGVCASVAAGAVTCTTNHATLTTASVSRGVFAAASDAADDIETRYGDYRFVACTGDAPEDFYLGIHQRMTDLEKGLVVGDDADLVVFDGPLRGRADPRAVGYVKTQHVQYLPDELQGLLGRLDAGQRTPIFALSSWGMTLYSWYLRLPVAPSHALAGIVRCEVPAVASVADTIAAADRLTALLPRYASEPHKDGRAPQNLYPIAGLERELRRRLGDQYLLERALRLAALN